MLTYKPIINNIHYNGYTIGVLRLDMIDKKISGNKWFKLKYNLQQAKSQASDTVITFGGAFSNHIAATAYACKLNKLNSIGIIRGEESSVLNPTLQLAKQHGMQLLFTSREDYKLKGTASYLVDLQKKYPNAYIIPEGGDNELGTKGCTEILTNECNAYGSIMCACGTQTTFNGIAQSLQNHQFLYGVNVLKYNAMSDLKHTRILNEYHFGGYAKHTDTLLYFKHWFENEYAIALDYVYTTKLFFAAFDLMKQEVLDKNTSILLVHTGGLQGNIGYENRYNLKPNRQVTDAHG